MLKQDITKEETPIFIALIREFCTAISSMAAQETSVSVSAYSYSAFSTNSKGNSFKDSPAAIQRLKGSRIYAYRQEHIFDGCYYYNPKIRPFR